jgi:hypothetical protein
MFKFSDLSYVQIYIISFNLGCFLSGMHLLVVGLVFKAFRSTSFQQFIERQVSEKHVEDIETLAIATILTGAFLALFGLIALVGTFKRSKSMLILYLAFFGSALIVGSAATINDWIYKSQYSFLSNLEVFMNLFCVFSVCYFIKTMDKDQKETENDMDIEKQPFKEPF